MEGGRIQAKSGRFDEGTLSTATDQPPARVPRGQPSNTILFSSTSMDLEPNSAVTLPTLTRSPDVWFHDGTVVLQAESALFRVYRGVLAAQSPIFRDTFAIPQPPTQDTYDGCPLVLLHDSPEDLKLFLLAIHDAGYVHTFLWHIFTLFEAHTSLDT
jgi:hypothetical protein